MIEHAYRPRILRLSQVADKEEFDKIKSDKNPAITNTLRTQLGELLAIIQPNRSHPEEAREAYIAEKLAGRREEEYGLWVYFPWRNHLIHLPEEEEFIAIRTSRNKYKITPDEQEILRQKTIAIAGLSVGNNIACTIALERLAGKLKLADFDDLELSNMNRIRSSMCDLGQPKAIITARQIAEIDPFIEVELFQEGITPSNLRDFLIGGGAADVLIEVCDSLDIKIMLREACRDSGIPVLMDTSDRCMIDVERYDWDKGLPLLHGLAGDLNTARLRDLSNPEKIPYMLKMIGLETLSARAKVSMLEIGQSIPTWPQLASTVVMGAGITADVCRRMLLGYEVASGRYYADPEQLIPGRSPLANSYQPPIVEPLRPDDLRQITDPLIATYPSDELPEPAPLDEMITMAGMAPSSGNDQPWHFYAREGHLFLFHELSRTYSFGDYRNLASQISMGAALENLHLAAIRKGWSLTVEPWPTEDERLVARIVFRRSACDHPWPELVEQVPERHTIRSIEAPQPIAREHLDLLVAAAESIPGARLQLTTSREDMDVLGSIISKVDRMRIFDPQGHYDFFHREMKWSEKQAIEEKTGMWIGTLEIPPVFVKALEAVKEPEVINTLRAIDGGKSFEQVTRQSTSAASAMGFLTMPRYGREDFLHGGIAGQRLWLMATRLGIAFHPLIAPLYLFPRMLHGAGEGLSEGDLLMLRELRKQFSTVFETRDDQAEIYLFRIFIPKKCNVIRPFRLPLETIFTKAE